MCGFIAQLVEHRTGIRGGHGFESRWSLDFFRLLLSNCLNWKKFTAMVILHFDLQPQFKYMNYFIYTSHHFTPHGRYELNKLASLPMCGFIAQLVEHRTGIRGGHGFESRWSLDFFRLLLSNCLNWKKFTAMVILHFDLQPQFKYMNYFIYTSHHFTPHGRYELNKLASLPMCGFIAQLVEHRTGIRGGHGFESRWSLDFFRLLLSNCLNWKKFTAMVILHFDYYHCYNYYYYY